MRACAALLLARILVAQSVPQWQDLNRAARAARQAKDYAVLRENLRKLYAMAPGHPRSVYGIAASEAMVGNQQARLDWLRIDDGMGLACDIADDKGFAPIKADD